MAIFPWDDWFYKIAQQEKGLNDLYNKYLHQRDDIAALGAAYNRTLDNYRGMVALNQALLIAVTTASMSDADYATWLEETLQDNPPAPELSAAIVIFQGFVELFGTLAIGAFIFKGARMLGSTATTSVKTAGRTLASEAQVDIEMDGLVDGWVLVSEDVGLTMDGDMAASRLLTEATTAIPEATSAGCGLLATGGAIFVAVGLDALVGWREGAQENSQIEEHRVNLTDSLSKVTAFLDKLHAQDEVLKAGIVRQEQEFLRTMRLLDVIQPASFDFALQPTLGAAPDFRNAMQNAARQYGYLSQIRDTWTKVHHNNPDIAWSAFTSFVTVARPATMSEEEAGAFLDYARSRSESMRLSRDI